MDQNIKPEQRKPLSMSSNVNQVYHRQNKRSITNETLKAAEEILAVLQDSPVKINKKDVGTDQHKLKAKEVRKVDNKNRSEELNKLDDTVIAGLLFDSDDENNCDASVNGTEKITYIKHKSPKKSKKSDIKNESKTNKSVNSPDNKLYFDEEDILVNLSDVDESLNNSKTDKVGEWIITKSPRNKLQSPQRNQNVNNHSTNGIVVTGNKARRSLVLQLDSVKVNGSTNSPLRLKLKRKATSEIDEDEPNCKERRKETIGQDPSKNEDHESKGLRSREKLKLPKWRREESSECGWSPRKSGKMNYSPSTPKTNKKKISLSKNTTPNVSKLSSSSSSPLKDSSPLKSSNSSESNSVKDKTSPELIKSAAEIYDILNTPEKGINEKVNGSSDCKLNKVASVRLLKYDDRQTPLLKSKNAKSLNSNCSPHTPQSKKKNHVSGFESPGANKSINKHAAETPSPRRSKRTRVVDIDSDSCSAPSSPVPSVKNNCSASKTENSLTKIRNQNTPNNKIKEFNHLPLRSCDKKSKKQTTHEKISENDITSRAIASPKKSSKVSEKSFITRNDSLQVGLNTSSSLDEARTQLLASTVPQSLPCRDKEFNNIYGFILRKIDDLAGGCMYISGVPGTGKTATVHAVVRKLQLEAKEDDDVPDFDFVEINGLRLTEPRQAYTRMWQTLSGQRLTPEQAQRCLDRRFSFNAKKPTVLLVDELDYLCNRRQDVVYNILDWPTKQGSALVILTIANTMDLPERTLKGKITSRMGLTRLMFQPYTHHQLQEIVLNRLSGSDSFHPDAVQLVARKVAAVSGDARRALDICRRSTELVDSSGIVTIQTVEKALSQIFMGPRIRAIRSCSTMAQLVMRALRDETLRTGVDESNISKVYQHLKNICALEGVENPTTGDVLSISTTLEHLGLVVAEKGRPDLVRKLSLNVSSDDIHYALNC